MIAGHKRMAYKHATFLFHEGSISGVHGDANKFQNYADYYKSLRGVMKELVLEKTNITEEEYSLKEKDDWWLMASEAVEKGIIDEIVTGTWYC
jgi:ATP-dependent protease ClpP protease subunit